MDIDIPGYGVVAGDGPIVILGTNGSGKTRLAQQIAGNPNVTSVGAQRRTWVDDSLPVQEEGQMRNNVLNYQNNWRNNSWQPGDEINFILSTLVQEHTSAISRRNEEAIASSNKLDPVTDTKLIRLQGVWRRIYPNRKLEIGGFFPQVSRLDGPAPARYKLRQMSDGERSVLYLSARILDAEPGFVLIDEPELHLHSRLAVQFWTEVEKLRPDCRFIYVTHDLNFTLSRRQATVLVARAGQAAEAIIVEALPATVATEILGAATLPFHAKRIFFFEGEGETAFASEFFAAWFDDSSTFAVPAGNRDAVISAVTGLSAVGVSGAEIIGLIDRDYYSDAALLSVPNGIRVLDLHEIESVLCDPDVVRALGSHYGKNPDEVIADFDGAVRKIFVGKTLSHVIASRVRARVSDLLRGAFSQGQIRNDVDQTSIAHVTAVAELDLPHQIQTMFDEEEGRLVAALGGSPRERLRLLPGKHLLSILASRLGLNNAGEITSLVARALRPPVGDLGVNLKALGAALELALSTYLPPRRISG